MGFRLKHGEAVGQSLRRVAVAELETAVKSLALPPGKRDKGIHEARKSLKKARAVLCLMMPAERPADQRETRRQNRRLRDAGRQLSGFRDAAVAIATLDSLVARYRPGAANKGVIDKGIGTFRASLVKQKLESEGAGIDAALQKITKLLADSECLAKSWELKEEGAAAIRPGLHKAFRRARKALHAARGHFTSPLGHQFRKRVKVLWYAVRLLNGVWLHVGDLQKQLNQLETLLGEDHNLAMLTEKLQPVKRKLLWRRRLDSWIAEHRLELCHDAETIAEEIFAERPAAFVDRTLLSRKAAA